MSLALSWFGQLGAAAYAGWSAASAVFRKEAFRSYPAPAAACHRSDDYGCWDYRRLRYELFWSYYENNAYDSIHTWASQLRDDYNLYRHIRGIYNPSYRLIEFWATHIWAGTIDPASGDGKSVPSALPIETTDDRLRVPITRILRDSDWQTNKTIVCRLGACLGDVGIKVCDDQEKGRVILEVVHPASLPWVSKDTRGNVRGYVQEDRRPNPDFDPMRPPGEDNKEFARYTETCVRGKDGVVRYSTRRDGRPYNWTGRGESWPSPYPFVPLVMIQHIKVDPNESFGLSELFAGRAKIDETNDGASKLRDQIRKTVEGAWLMAGMRAPKDGANPLAQARAATRDNRAPDRTDVPVIYAGQGATAMPLVLPLSIQETSQEIQNGLRDFEIDYSELYHLRVAVSGDASGESRREARKPAEAKVYERRAGYDGPLQRALGMAIAIGGYRGYRDHEGFDFNSYAKGDLDFRIGNRPVFNVDVFDELERKRQLWTNVGLAVGAGYPIRLNLMDEGWSADHMKEFDAEMEKQVQAGIDLQTRLAEAQAQVALDTQAASAAVQPVVNGTAA